MSRYPEIDNIHAVCQEQKKELIHFPSSRHEDNSYASITLGII